MNLVSSKHFCFLIYFLLKKLQELFLHYLVLQLKVCFYSRAKIEKIKTCCIFISLDFKQTYKKNLKPFIQMSSYALTQLDKLFEEVDQTGLVQYQVLTLDYVSQAIQIVCDAFQLRDIKDPSAEHVPYRIFHDFYADVRANGLHMFLLDVEKERPIIDRVMDFCDDLEHEWVSEVMSKASNSHTSSAMEKNLVFHICQIAVDRHYLNKGIGTGLIKQSCARAKQLGFRSAAAEVTNDISFRCFEKCGFKCKNFFFYKDWEYPKHSGKFPLTKWTNFPLYDKLRLMALQL
ncbi:hypothetical protein RFI_17268 [Reticulomyxa filosa]|uniref:N-acetyltransferase domain-containing protein n=1 Tax=Reticulomyxa filosa TaxID=46433 RepID=X6N240_RETFI|nr:hypothetical protein RFI_17268 [Reticulomyxa filosa]|eukprot:ETO19953.1 hypothetical protein RFI_17268 [Reticulomyxa filosa]